MNFKELGSKIGEGAEKLIDGMINSLEDALAKSLEDGEITEEEYIELQEKLDAVISSIDAFSSRVSEKMQARFADLKQKYTTMSNELKTTYEFNHQIETIENKVYDAIISKEMTLEQRVVTIVIANQDLEKLKDKCPAEFATKIDGYVELNGLFLKGITGYLTGDELFEAGMSSSNPDLFKQMVRVGAYKSMVASTKDAFAQKTSEMSAEFKEFMNKLNGVSDDTENEDEKGKRM